LNKIYTPEEIAKERESPSFEREYNLKYIGQQNNAIINKNISNLQTKMLNDAPRDTDRLEALMKAKESYIETRVARDTIRSITSTPLIEAAMSE
jgi:hypothetical protein